MHQLRKTYRKERRITEVGIFSSGQDVRRHCIVDCAIVPNFKPIYAREYSKEAPMEHHLACGDLDSIEGGADKAESIVRHGSLTKSLTTDPSCYCQNE